MKPIEILEKELAKAQAEEAEAHKGFRRDANAGAEKEWLKAMEHRQRLAEEKSTSGRVIAHLVKEASATPRSGSSPLLESGPYLIVRLKEFDNVSLGLFLKYRNARSPHSRDGRGFR